jgi:hypothetical protein
MCSIDSFSFTRGVHNFTRENRSFTREFFTFTRGKLQFTRELLINPYLLAKTPVLGLAKYLFFPFYRRFYLFFIGSFPFTRGVHNFTRENGSFTREFFTFTRGKLRFTRELLINPYLLAKMPGLGLARYLFFPFYRCFYLCSISSFPFTRGVHNFTRENGSFTRDFFTFTRGKLRFTRELLMNRYLFAKMPGLGLARYLFFPFYRCFYLCSIGSFPFTRGVHNFTRGNGSFTREFFTFTRRKLRFTRELLITPYLLAKTQGLGLARYLFFPFYRYFCLGSIGSFLFTRGVHNFTRGNGSFTREFFTFIRGKWRFTRELLINAYLLAKTPVLGLARYLFFPFYRCFYLCSIGSFPFTRGVHNFTRENGSFTREFFTFTRGKLQFTRELLSQSSQSVQEKKTLFERVLP